MVRQQNTLARYASVSEIRKQPAHNHKSSLKIHACTSKHRLSMFIQFTYTFGINVSHKILKERIVNHMVLQAHGMPCEPFIQIC